MDTLSSDVAEVERALDRLRAGELSARDDLLTLTLDRLEALIRQYFRRFPRLCGWTDPDDVLQNAVLRLRRALPRRRPISAARFFGLARSVIWLELLDEARRCRRASEHGTPATGRLSEDGWRRLEDDLPDRADDTDDQEDWTWLRERLAGLPARERITLELRYYHHWSEARIAKGLTVTERTVRRYQRSSIEKLRQAGCGDTAARRRVVAAQAP